MRILSYKTAWTFGLVLKKKKKQKKTQSSEFKYVLNIKTNIIRNIFVFQPSLSTPSSASKVNTSAFLTPLELKAKAESDDVKKSPLDELRAQMNELLGMVDALRRDHG